MPRELLTMQSGAWQEVQGQDITVDNCLRSRIRDLRIEGQTYQNLLSETKKLGKFVYNDITGEYTLTNPSTGVWNTLGIRYTRPIQSGEKLLIRINFVKNTIESTQTPSIKVTYSDGSSSTKGFINVENNFTGLLEYYCDGAVATEPYNTKIEISTRNYSSGELVVKDIQVIPVSSNPLSYTELPVSINGIESVAEREREGDLYPIILAQSPNETLTKINLPQPLRSLPNGVRDTIEGNKLVQRVGVSEFDGSTDEEWTFESLNKNGNGLLNIYIVTPNVVVKEQSEQALMCDKFPQQKLSIVNTTTEGVLINNQKRIWLRLYQSNATTVDEAKNYLSNNPITVYYELETPIVHDLTIPSIYTEKGTNIITTENNIKPKLSMKVKVKK